MKKIHLLILGLCLSTAGFAQNASLVSTFPNLKTLELPGNIRIYYPATAEIINTACGKLPESDPYYAQPDYPSASDIKALRVSVGPEYPEKLVIIYSEGPSADPEFMIGREDGTVLSTLGGTELYIPGNGYVYTCGISNTSFNKRSKYRFNGKEFSEVRQAYYYVGKNTSTTREITLWADLEETVKVGTVPANTEVEVVLTVFQQQFGGTEHFLIRTPFGLLGWYSFTTYQLDQTPPLKDIWYHGD